MGNLLGRRLVVHFMVALHPSLFPFLLHHLRSQVPVLGYLHHQRVLRIRRTALLGPSSPLSRVRNMVFFELFLCYFSRLSMLFYPFTLFSLSFTLTRKGKTCALPIFSPPMSKYSSSTMATSSVTMDCWDPGALFSLSEELADDEGNPELGPGIKDYRAGMGIGMGGVPP